MHAILQRSLLELVFETSGQAPEKKAIISFNGEEQTYAQLSYNINNAAIFLKDQGVTTGDRVLIFSEKNAFFPVNYLAVHLAGGVAVPISPDTTKKRLSLIKDICYPKIIIDDNLDKLLNEKQAGCNCENATNSRDFLTKSGDLLFTTGTTGTPKGVFLTQENISASVANINSYVGTHYDDTEVIALPLSHSFGLGRMRCVLAAGGTIVLVNGFSRPKRLFKALDDYNATGFGMVPAAWETLRKTSGNRISRFADQLKYIEFGSAPMSVDQKLLLSELLPKTRLFMHYGLTEASRSTFQDFHQDSDALDSIGRPSPFAEVSIRDSSGSCLGIEKSGEICVKGPIVTAGYWDDPDLTRRSFWGEWLRTGDLGYCDSRGYLYLQSRTVEIINVGGQKVVPNEIEGAIQELDLFNDVACTSIPDDLSGEAVAVYAVLHTETDITLDSLRRDLKDKLEHYKLPTYLFFVKNIPKTSSGKIQRRLLGRPEDMQDIND